MTATVEVICRHCGETFERDEKEVKRALAWGRKLYCSTRCVRILNRRRYSQWRTPQDWE